MARRWPYNALLRILISAGEASGEMYGAQLIEALYRVASQKRAELCAAGRPGAVAPKQALEFFGAGGRGMRAAGCDTVVDAKDLSVVGITEILRHLPRIYSLYKHLLVEADRRKPDLAIVIDSPAFNWRVARQMKRRGVPVVYYVAPQFWAWRQERVRLLRDYVDKALVIFPFEEKFYRDHDVDATFVGHPLAELPNPTIPRNDYAAQFRLDAAKQWITIMPGSRMKEARMNLPTILEAARQLGQEYEFLLPVAPTLDAAFLKQLIDRREVDRTGDKIVSLDAANITLVPESLPALWHSRAGIIASGTATVEAAMMGTPFVMVYCVSSLTYFLGKPRVKVPYFAMVNLIDGEQVVPELVQHDFTAENVVAQVQRILPESEIRETMLTGLARVKAKLRGDPGKSGASRAVLYPHPAERAAQIIFNLVDFKSGMKSGLGSARSGGEIPDV